MYLVVDLSTSEFIAYADAARLLRHALGPKAPELPEILGMEFEHRSSKTIAEEYLERHGHPPLRRCVRERRLALTKAPRRRRIRVIRPKRTPVLDPSRN